MTKTIIKLQPGDVVTIDKDKMIIEAKENTTAENSDVKRKPSRTTIVQCGRLIELD